jgi:hypothetical protein
MIVHIERNRLIHAFGLLLLAVLMLPANEAAAAGYRLSQAEASLAEGETLRLRVYRDDGRLAEELVWHMVNLDASPDDYNYASWYKIRFAAGETSKRIVVRAYEDARSEGDERFRIELGRVSGGGSFRAPRTATVTITDPAGAGNAAPVITGQPLGDAEAGTPWSFTPSASDADGDPLTFSITNRPDWARFDAATGRLSGTPGGQDVGTFADISIQVSDGQDQSSLAAFGITVRNSAENAGTAALHWTPPTSRVDGSPLGNLAGYRIYRGSSRDSLDIVRQVNNPGVTTFLVEGLSAGQWHFAISAIDGDGQESLLSNVVSRWVN